MMSNPIISSSSVPLLGHVTNGERLGLGPSPSMTIPETARAVIALEEGAAAQAFMARQQLSQQPNGSQLLQSLRTSAGWGMQMRVAAASINPDGLEYRAPRRPSRDEDSGDETPLDYRFNAVLTRRVQVAVRLGLPSEEVGRQLNIVV